MFASQFIFVIIIIFIIYKTLAGYKRNRLSKYFTVVWLLLWAFILFILFDQALLSRMAQMLGIGRGVDLAVYTSVIVIFYLIYVIFTKLQEIEKKITSLVRNESLMKASTVQKKVKNKHE